MKVLLATHHLRERAGSELYTYELATALREAGHHVGVFTFMVGSVALELRHRGIEVWTLADQAEVERFAPDVAHVHHAPCLYALGAMKLHCAVLFSSLGPRSELEAAPIVWDGVGRALAVSEEVKSRLESTPFGAKVPVSLFRNWFDDRLFPAGRPRAMPRPPGLRRLAVVTNHLDDRVRDALHTLTHRRPGFQWVHLGMPENSRPVTPEVLAGFDAVITIGRTVLLAAAMGKPCLVYDLYGSSGWLRAEELGAQRAVNFSGRSAGPHLSADELEVVFQAAPELDTEKLSEQVWREYALTARLPELLSLYRGLVDGEVRFSESTRARYGMQGQLHAAALKLGDQAAAASREQSLLAELVRARKALALARDKEHELAAFTDGLLMGLALRLARGLQSFKEDVLPEASVRRRAYDRARAQLVQRARLRLGTR